MEELIAVNEGMLSVLDDITRRVQYYAKRNVMDWLELGKALTEAKELVDPGKWLDYVKVNAGMGKRMCQNCMQAYRKFGTGNPDISDLSIGQVIPLLPASDEEIKALMDGNDVSSMSSREIQKAIQNARREGREEAEQEQAEKTREALKCMADDKASALAKQKMAFDEELRKQVSEAKSESTGALEALRAELNESLAAVESLRLQVEEAESRAKDATQAAIDAGKDVSAQSNRLESEARRLRRELEDRDAEIEDMQRKYDAMRDDLIAAQQIVARGDAERTNADILSAEAVGDAVRVFIGQVGRVPYMHGTFATMDAMEREAYRANVEQVLEWAGKSLKALDTIDGNGGVVE